MAGDQRMVRLMQDVINDEDLDRVSIKELRSMFIHMQTALFEDDEYEMDESELSKHIL